MIGLTLSTLIVIYANQPSRFFIHGGYDVLTVSTVIMRTKIPYEQCRLTAKAIIKEDIIAAFCIPEEERK